MTTVRSQAINLFSRLATGCVVENITLSFYEISEDIVAKLPLKFKQCFVYLCVSFCLPGAVENASALFTYDSEYLLDTYCYAPRHDPDFTPVFSIPENPNDPLANETSEICVGEGSQFCR